VNEDKDFRPRLNEKEIHCWLVVVDLAERFLDRQEKAFKTLEYEVIRLRQEMRIGNTMAYKDLKVAREKLEAAKGLPMWIQHQRTMLSSLKRRFESITKGGKRHRHSTYDWVLDTGLSHSLEPKRL